MITSVFADRYVIRIKGWARLVGPGLGAGTVCARRRAEGRRKVVWLGAAAGEGRVGVGRGGVGVVGVRVRGGRGDARPRALVIVRAMSRIPYVRREELGPEGQQLWDGIVDGRSDLVLTAEGGLAGPFNASSRRRAPGGGCPRWGRSCGSARRSSGGCPRSRSSRSERGGRRSSNGGRTRPWRASTACPTRWWTRSDETRIRRSRRTTSAPSTRWPVNSASRRLGPGDLRRRAPLSRRRRDGRAGVAVRVLHADLVPAERVHRAAAAGNHTDVGRVMTLQAEATGAAPGRQQADRAAGAGGRRGDAAIAGTGSAARQRPGH